MTKHRSCPFQSDPSISTRRKLCLYPRKSVPHRRMPLQCCKIRIGNGTGSILVIRLMQSDEEGWGNRFGSGETVSRRYADELESPKLSQNHKLKLRRFWGGNVSLKEQ